MKRIQIASKGRRIASSLIDLAIIAGLFCLSYFFIFYKAVSAVQHFDNQNQIIKEERIKSGLFIEDGTKTILQNNPNISYQELDKACYKYYCDYLYELSDKSKELYTPYWYSVEILHLEDSLNKIENKTSYTDDQRPFKWNVGYPITTKDYNQYKVKDNITENDLKDFFKLNFSNAVNNLTLNDLSKCKNAARVISFGTMRALLYSSMLSTFIPCFIIPISLKNGKTIGKLITKLVVLTDEGYEYKRYKHIFRYLSFYVVEVFGGVITIGLTFILSTSLVLFSKKRRALHDYISFSVVADEEHSVFYLDKNEEDKYKEKSVTTLSLE